MGKRSLQWLTTFLVSLLIASFSSASYAQTDMSIAIRKVLNDNQTQTGDIISLTNENQFVRSSVTFDPTMYGVVAETATLVYHPDEEGTPLVRAGEAVVNVTTLGGEIVPGDLITSSPLAGKGQKTSIAEGWIVGIARTGLSQGEGEEIAYEGRALESGSVVVDLRIGAASQGSGGDIGKIIDQLGGSLLRNVDTPTNTNNFLRYSVAGLLALAVIAIGFASFGRNITRGIEAIGRNPLAKRQIQAMIALNILLIGVISFAGIVLSLAIIRY